MKSELINAEGEKTWVLVFDTGDEAIVGLVDFARQHRLAGGHFSAIGGFSDVTLGFFEFERRDYKRIPLVEQLEVLSLLGDIAEDNGEPKIHAHVVVGNSEGLARGGHLIQAHVRPTLEVIVVEAKKHLHRRSDPRTGLALLKL